MSLVDGGSYKIYPQMISKITAAETNIQQRTILVRWMSQRRDVRVLHDVVGRTGVLDEAARQCGQPTGLGQEVLGA